MNLTYIKRFDTWQIQNGHNRHGKQFTQFLSTKPTSERVQEVWSSPWAHEALHLCLLCNIILLVYKSCSMGPQNITMSCSKSCVGRLRFKLNSQHLIVIVWGPTLLINVMKDLTAIFIYLSLSIFIYQCEHSTKSTLVLLWWNVM